MRAWILAAAALAVPSFALPGCMGTPDEVGSARAEIVGTDMSVYVQGTTVTVSWTNICGGTATVDDWVSIAPVGSAPGDYIAWQYTGVSPATGGSLNFASLPVGTFVARTHCSWSTTYSNNIDQESPSFVINSGGGTPAIVTDAGTYTVGTNIITTYSNAPGFPLDWVAIARAGDPLGFYFAWQHTGGAINGNATFSSASLSPGTYVARLFRNNTEVLVAESATFTVNNGTAASVDAPGTVATNTAFSVSFAGASGSTTDWVAIAPAGAPATSYVAWAYTGGGTTGSVNFAGLAFPGNYEARLYFDWAGTGSFNVEASDPFVVSGTPASFVELTGDDRTLTYTVSRDGAYAGGFLRNNAAMNRRGARWTADNASVDDFGNPDGGANFSNVYGLNSDGSIAVGYTSTPTSNEWFRWDSGTGMVPLGIPGFAYAISANGSTIVGSRTTIAGYYAGGTFTSLGDLPTGDPNSEAFAVNNDGTVIVGWGSTDAGTEPWRWTSAGGMVSLGNLGSQPGYAYAVSADGSIVAGSSTSASGREAFRWTSGGMVGLGDLAGGAFSSFAAGCSSDCSVIVGGATTAAGLEAFIWDSSNGMRRLQDVLTTAGATNLTGWTLETAWQVSDDGKVITGIGYNPSGQTRGFVATLP